MEVTRIIIGFIGGAGLSISLLFLFTAGRWTELPRLCRLDRGECGTVLAAPQAKMLGIPNYLFGIAFYVLVLAAAAIMPMEYPDTVFWVLFAATFLAVFTGAYLLFSLIFTLRANCPLCYASHALNFILMATLIFHVISNL